MHWTRWAGMAAGLLVLAGCSYGYRTVAFQARYSTASRPHPSYFCYDCHGYRYFDPYYDWCVAYGFRYRWSAYPQVVAVYRDRYVRIRESHPDYGRYRYREDYRAATRYRDPRDYETWRRSLKATRKPAPSDEPGRKVKVREKDGEKPRRKERKGDERKGPRDPGSRPTLPGGMS